MQQSEWLMCKASFFQPLKMGRNFLFGCVLVFSFFSTQNQVPQVIIGLLKPFHIKDFSVVIQTIFPKNLQKNYVEKKF